MVGVNPEVAHEHMAGLNFMHHVAQAWDDGQALPHRPERPGFGRYDQDLRFGSDNLKAAFFLVKFLEDVGYPGSRHFDSHAYRTEDCDGVKDFARGCMRTYLIYKEKARRWNEDKEIQALVAADQRRRRHGLPHIGGYSRSSADALKAHTSTARRSGARGLHTRSSTSSRWK